MGELAITLVPEGFNAIMGVDGAVAKFIAKKAELVKTAAQAGVGHDTGQLAQSLGIELKVTGTGAAAQVSAKIGVRRSANSRKDGGGRVTKVTRTSKKGKTSRRAVTNSMLLQFEEHGNGHEPAKHTMSQALLAARG